MIKPNYYAIHYYLAKAYNNVRRSQQALSAANDCLKYNKDFANAYIEIGQAYENMGNINKAIENYNKAGTMDVRLKKWVDWKINNLRSE